MKRIITLLIFAFSLGLHAQTPEDIFKEANTLYKQTKYEEALTKYKSIEETGFVSDDLFYNMANVYYKLEETAPAILYYKRALKINPNLDDAKFNLKMAQLRTVDKIEKVPVTFFVKFWNWLANILTVHQWSVFSVFMAFFSTIAFVFYYFAKSSVIKRVSFIKSVIALILMIVAIVIAHQQSNWEDTHKDAVIMAENSYIKVAPNENSEDKFILHEGTEAMVIDQVDDWKRIKLADGKVGWIHSSDLEEV
jgi:tetratricopeptide (TPR) repeat protein